MRKVKLVGARQREISSVGSLLAAGGAFLLPVLLCPTPAKALECGAFTFPKCSGEDVQFDGGFDPKVGYGGFGGGACRASKTPVVFIHGNGDRAINWASPVVGTVGGYVPPKHVFEPRRAGKRRRQLSSTGEVRRHPRLCRG